MGGHLGSIPHISCVWQVGLVHCNRTPNYEAENAVDSQG